VEQQVIDILMITSPYRPIIPFSPVARVGQCVAVFRARDIGVPVVTVGTIERDWHPSSGWLP